MSRIPELEIERLKQKVSIQRLVESIGVTLKRHGADLIGLCPFHDDHEPSLVISPTKNLWHCLGVCQAGGSVIDWVMRAEGVSFRHAVELLQADYQPLAAGSPIKRSTVQKLPTALAPDAEDAKLLRQVVDYYHETLKQSPEALAYLEKRGIGLREAIEHFRLGLANRTLGYRLPAKNRREGAAIRGQLQRLGLFRPSGHEHFNGSLVIPVFDEKGHVTELYGRKLNDHLRKGSPLHLYLPGPHQGVWNAEALAGAKEVILCESLIDALTFWCAGYRNVTASYGVEGFTADHLAAFKQHGIERVLIAYDRDAAGEAAAEKLARQLTAEGLDCYRLHFPKGMDANQYALQVRPATQSLGVVIRSAIWLGTGEPKPITTVASAHGVPESIPQAVPETPPPADTEVPARPLAAEDEPEPLSAAAIPEPPQADVAAEVTEREVLITLGERRYRIRGLEKNLSYEAMKVNLLVSAPANGAPPPGAPSYRPSVDIFDGPGEAVHVDTLDLYQARPRGVFIKQAADELGVKEDLIKRDLGRVLLKLEALQEARIRAAQEPKSQAVTLSDEETQAALALLQSPELLARIVGDFARCGVVGESTNVLTGYLACVSRKLDGPLAVLIQSTSAAGKSALMEAVLALMPEEERIQYSAMTGQSLFYLGEHDLKHKILAIAEEEGVSEAAYALKLLQSQGELTIASTGKDATTGKLITQEYRVEGPVMIFLTTTAIELDEELLNRCLVLTVNESREQTQAIQDRQRFEETLEGLLAAQVREEVLRLHRNAQRLLRPLAVVNPYADRLTFLSDKTRTRRDHRKYLTLIRTIALLHQHQREVKTITHNGKRVEYIEVTLSDIETANHLAHEVLGRTLDELPPQTRHLLRLIHEMVIAQCCHHDMIQADYRFSRRDVREASGWTDFQVKTHMHKLEAMKYVLVHRGGRGQSFVYELFYNGEGLDERRFLMGLIEATTLAHGYDTKKEHPQTDKAHARPEKERSSSPQVAAKEPPSRPTKSRKKGLDTAACDEPEENASNCATQAGKNTAASYRSHPPTLAVQVAE